MCNIWKYPSVSEEEISLETLNKLPNNFGIINLTGGEPTLRKDLGEIVDLLYPKTKKLEISSNGLLPNKLEPIIRKYPDIKIRFSLEGADKINNYIRGEKDGYSKKVNGLARLQELGGKDLGFATVIQDDNVTELVDLFRFTEKNGFELSTSTLHNGFQFHKNDNDPYDRVQIAHSIESLIIEQLKSRHIKNWFRAYVNLGLEAKVLGSKRLLPCRHGYESVFLDPWGKVYACNVRPDLYLGDLEDQTWSEIITGEKALQALSEVNKCQQNCWMAGVAKGAMRNHYFPRLPRLKPLVWVVSNKIRLLLKKNINFQKYVTYPAIRPGTSMKKPSYLNVIFKRTAQKKCEQHYSQTGGFFNQ
jgi:radical SAM protein with 4Fe4S-binding SPASM domain